MKVSIFQPTYLPWLGFIKAIAWSDKFVFLDDVQYENHSWQSRNIIKSNNGELMLSVPIIRNFPQKINEVKINYSQNWIKKHIKSMRLNYANNAFFNEFFPYLEVVYQRRPEKLLDFNVEIIKNICEFLEIKTDFYYASDLDAAELRKNDKVIAILKKLGADQYLHAEGSWEYMQEALGEYQKNKIELIPLRFEHPEYKQLHGEFISHLSIIDAIFNCGRAEVKAMINDIKLENN